MRLRKQAGQDKLTQSAPYIAYRESAGKALFPLFMDSKNLRQYNKTLAALCRCRVNSSKIENQVMYIANAPESLKKKFFGKFHKFFLQKKADYEINHNKTKTKLRGIPDKKRQEIFNNTFGWRL